MVIFFRSAVFNAYFFSVTAVCSVLGLLALLGGRRALLALARVWVRLVLRGLRVICGIRVSIVGRHHLPAHEPAVIAVQHQSALDTLVWVSLLRQPCYVLKEELTGIPVFGWLLQPAGMIAIDRKGGARALRRLIERTKHAAALGYQMVIFPEGTRVAPGAQAKLHPGVVAMSHAASLPVIPVATDAGRFWGRRAFRKHPGAAAIVIGPPIAAGLSRDELLSAIYTHWTSAEQHCFPA